MMKNVMLILTVLSLAMVVGCGKEDAQAPATAPATSQPAASAAPGAEICPVTGEPIDASVTRVTVNGKSYGFCCPDCIDKFKKSPAKYLSSAISTH